MGKRIKIAVIRFSSIGDIVILNPVFKSIKESYKNSEITFITKKENNILKDNPFIDNFFYYNKKEIGNEGGLSYLIKKMRFDRFDYVFDMHNNLRSNILTMFIRKRKVYKIKKAGFKRRLIVRIKLNLLRDKKKVITRYYEVLKKAGVVKEDGFDTGIYTDKRDDGNSERIIKSINSKNKIIAVAPGAKWNTKEWPYYREFIKMLSGISSIHILIIGLKGDYKKRDSRANITDLTGKLSLSSVAALIKRIDCLICNDTGLMHIADGYNIRTFTFFGPTVEEFGFFPLNSKVHVLQTGINCRPCSLHGTNKCPKRHFRCLRDIKPAMVKELVLKYVR